MSTKNQIKYEVWVEKVNQILFLRLGLDTNVFIDQPWRDWYTNGLDAETAVKRALKNEGY